MTAINKGAESIDKTKDFNSAILLNRDCALKDKKYSHCLPYCESFVRKMRLIIRAEHTRSYAHFFIERGQGRLPGCPLQTADQL